MKAMVQEAINPKLIVCWTPRAICLENNPRINTTDSKQLLTSNL